MDGLQKRIVWAAYWLLAAAGVASPAVWILVEGTSR